MKYEIKEGMANVPISEVNRLNEVAVELEKREATLVEKEALLAECMEEYTVNVEKNTGMYVIHKEVHSGWYATQERNYVEFPEAGTEFKKIWEEVCEAPIAQAKVAGREEVYQTIRKMSVRDLCALRKNLRG